MIKIMSMRKDPQAVKDYLMRNTFEFDAVNQVVEEILADVKSQGDAALRMYTERFDGVNLEQFVVEDWVIKQAFANTDAVLIADLQKAMANIEAYHQKQALASFEYSPEPGVTLGQLVRPLDSVGIYVPGGTAAYPSTVLMNAVPAKVAGVKNIVMVTPPNKQGKIKDSVLVAAKLAGVDTIYKIGGAQAVAALAYGTETVQKVDKIVGPGNIYVAMAKKQVSGYVGIDMVAGPSEILIIGDASSNPDYIAADLMGQAEHDILAAAILVTPSMLLATKVKAALEGMIEQQPRKTIIKEALQTCGAIIVTETLDDTINIANRIAPEHLEIMTAEPWLLVPGIRHAGALFVGAFTPEPVGDYFAGPNHTLPTSGTARFSSALSTTDFLKKTSLIQYDRSALERAKDSIVRLAEEEGLSAHAHAVKIRFEGTRD